MVSILVIDDDKLMQEYIREVLEGAGYEVRCANNGISGLKSYRQLPTELVLCDLFMPEKEGLETIQELHQEFPTIKVIAMSGSYSGKSRLDLLPVAKMFGPAATLQKPFMPVELVALVERVLLR